MYEDACRREEQLSEQQWAQAGALNSAGALQSALQAGTAAQKRLLKEHKGFLVSLVNKHTHQVQPSCPDAFASSIFSQSSSKELCCTMAPSTVKRAAMSALAVCAPYLQIRAMLWLASMHI